MVLGCQGNKMVLKKLQADNATMLIHATFYLTHAKFYKRSHAKLQRL